MADFNKEELLKIAQLAALNLNEQEVNLFGKQIATIIDYVDQIQEVKITTKAETVRNSNIFRDDEIKACNTEEILAQAPKRANRFFVVPKILD